jgi:hypothetical protein
MKRLLSILGLVVLITLPVLGCSESGAAAPADPVVTRSQLDGALNAIRNDTNSRIDKLGAPDLSAINNKINDITSKQTQQRTDFDALKKAVETLTTAAQSTQNTTGNYVNGQYVGGYQPTVPGYNSPLQTTTTSGGNGAIQIALQGFVQPIGASTSPVTQQFAVTLTDRSNVPQYFVPTVSIQPYYGQANGAKITTPPTKVTAQMNTYNLVFNDIPTGTPIMLAQTNAVSGGYVGGAVYVAPGAPALLMVTLVVQTDIPCSLQVSVSGSSSNIY